MCVSSSNGDFCSLMIFAQSSTSLFQKDIYLKHLLQSTHPARTALNTWNLINSHQFVSSFFSALRCALQKPMRLTTLGSAGPICAPSSSGRCTEFFPAQRKQLLRPLLSSSRPSLSSTRKTTISATIFTPH